MEVEGFGTQNMACSISSSLICAPATEDWQQLTYTRVLDQPGTSYVYSAEQPNDQARVLPYCENTANFTCTFTITSQSIGVSPPHTTNAVVNNSTGSPVTRTVDVVDPQTVTNSVGAPTPPNGGLSSAVAAGVQPANSSCTYTPSHTYTATVQITVPPYLSGFITGVTPQCVYTGNVVVTSFNTTWTLQDVTFYSPIATGQGSYQLQL